MIKGSVETSLIKINGTVCVAVGNMIFRSIGDAHEFLRGGGNSNFVPIGWSASIGREGFIITKAS